MKILKLIGLFTLQAIFYILDKITPTNNKTISFYVTDKTFGDNIKFFFDFVLEKKEYSPKLIFQDHNLYKNQKDKSNSYSIWSLRGLYQFLTSGSCVVQNGDAKLFFYPIVLNPKTKFILNLWHGIPLKRLNHQVKEYQNRRFSFQYQKFSAFTVCSDFEQLLISSCFHMDLDNIWVTGTPRNDKLNEQSLSANLASLENKNIILYAPTWREYGNKTSFFPFENFSSKELVEKLNENDQYLLLRGHRLEMDLLKNEYGELINKSTRIILADQQKYPDVNDLLKVTDLLVTDYSSIYLDFLLKNKPINFIPYDLDKYTKYRGFLMDYDKNTPGPKIRKFNEFLNSLDRKQLYENQEYLKKHFHKYSDTNARERIYKLLKKSLK